MNKPNNIIEFPKASRMSREDVKFAEGAFIGFFLGVVVGMAILSVLGIILLK